jgi:hypothetical protein
MYEFHYGQVHAKFGLQACLLNIKNKETIYVKGVPKLKFKQVDQSRNELRYKSFKQQPNR